MTEYHITVSMPITAVRTQLSRFSTQGVRVIIKLKLTQTLLEYLLDAIHYFVGKDLREARRGLSLMRTLQRFQRQGTPKPGNCPSELAEQCQRTTVLEAGLRRVEQRVQPRDAIRYDLESSIK